MYSTSGHCWTSQMYIAPCLRRLQEGKAWPEGQAHLGYKWKEFWCDHLCFGSHRFLCGGMPGLHAFARTPWLRMITRSTLGYQYVAEACQSLCEYSHTSQYKLCVCKVSSHSHFQPFRQLLHDRRDLHLDAMQPLPGFCDQADAGRNAARF